MHQTIEIHSMNIYKKLFKDTLIYGFATMLPRLIGVIMVPYHIKWMNNEAVYGSYSVMFSWIMILNAFLSFGMETAFFRFFNKVEEKEKVKSNALWFILLLSCFVGSILLIGTDLIASYLRVSSNLVYILLGILLLDAWVVIPFAMLRAVGQSKKYAFIKMSNVIINALLTVLFLYWFPKWSVYNGFSNWYVPNFQVEYVYLANLIASASTFVILLPIYKNLKQSIDKQLLKEMIKYAFPVMIASISFAINEGIDRFMIERLLPAEISQAEAGKYAACYKIGIFMILFRTMYSLGIEPFFFNYAKNADAPLKYATVTKYFVLFGSTAMLIIIVLADFLKPILISKPQYWSAMSIVPMVILANLLLGIYTNLSVWYKLQDKTWVGAVLSLLAAVITVLFNYLLIPVLGINAAALTTLIAYLFMSVFSYIIGQKYYPIPYSKDIIVYLLCSVVFSFLHFYIFRENYFIGTIFVIIFIAVIYQKERKKLKEIFKKNKKITKR